VTALPYNLNRLYTAAEFALLPEDNSFRYELQDGVITVRPRPANLHMKVLLRLGAQIDGQLPGNLDVLHEVKIDLGLSAPLVRVPDLVVLPSNFDHQGPNKASDILLAVEILSPGSIRLDTKDKPIDYAEAGIQNFWIVDPQPPVTATIYRLSGDNYEESQRAEHTFTVDEPYPLTIDLDALLPTV
jgi:Uma2 family endonuclease